VNIADSEIPTRRVCGEALHARYLGRLEHAKSSACRSPAGWQVNYETNKNKWEGREMPFG